VEDVETNLDTTWNGCWRAGRISEGAEAVLRSGAETVERILSESSDRRRRRKGRSRTTGEDGGGRVGGAAGESAAAGGDRERATDIHFQAGRNGVSVRRRIDGLLYDTQVPENIRLLYAAMVSR